MSTNDTDAAAVAGSLPDTPGGRLLAAAEEMVAVERGERAPAVERVYDGPVLVEVRERGKPVRRYRRPPEGSDLR